MSIIMLCLLLPCCYHILLSLCFKLFYCTELWSNVVVLRCVLSINNSKLKILRLCGAFDSLCTYYRFCMSTHCTHCALTRQLKGTKVLLYFLPVATSPLGFALLSGLLVAFPGMSVGLVLSLLLFVLRVYLLVLLLVLTGLLGFFVLLDADAFVVYFPILQLTVLP